MKKETVSRLWRGCTATCAVALALSLTATSAVNGFRTDIDKFLGTQSTRWVSDNSNDTSKTYTFKSDYKSTKDLVQAARDLGERMSEEGSVLMKNNGALPLSADETKKVSFLGFSSYYPVQGGDMGSMVAMNQGTDADTVDMVTAFKEKGYDINPTLESLYTGMKDKFDTEINNFGHVTKVSRITAPMIGEPFTNKEPSAATLDERDGQWKNSLNNHNVMIVTVARAAGENRNYTPGKAGVNPSDNLNQSDPLGLNDNERSIIDTAVAAKRANGGKVIVLVNSSSTMQLQEVADNDGVDAIVHVGLPGAYGFYGVADLLSGAANPSGHLSDTWVRNNMSTPAAVNYGEYPWKNADPAHMINSMLVEAEGIYTGYKYYETRYADSVTKMGNATSTKGSSNGSAWSYDSEVTYPFGHGLSYTTFTQKLEDVQVDLAAKTVTARVTVTNTGKVAGKDVVQLYVNSPYTDYDKEHKVEKAAVSLLDYAKTKELKAGESETVTIKADAQYMASWDSSADNLAGTKGTYILDAGTYTFAVGATAHDAVNNVLASQGAQGVKGETAQTATWKLDSMDTKTFGTTKNGTKVENQLADMDLNSWMPDTVTYLSRSDWDGTWPKTYEGLTATEEMLKGGLTNATYTPQESSAAPTTTWGKAGNGSLANVKGVKDINDPKLTSLMDQMKLSEAMIRTAFGGTSTKPIVSIGSPEAVQNDGPNGFGSYPLGQYANKDKSSGDPYAIDENDKNANYSMNVMANESIIGQTFNKELAQEWGKLIGNYSIWANTTILWGVGTNLHRVAYNSRNHEYYSEDSILAAFQGAASVAAAREYGAILAGKHFAFNDTEINRWGIAVFMTEQKAREGEVRANQSLVEDAKAIGMMTAFNRAGVKAANAHTGLLFNILRGEWGFQGLLSEDFIMDNEYQNLQAAAFNGVTMLTSTGDDNMAAVEKLWPYWNEAAVAKDPQMSAALKRNMTWQAYALANSNAMDGLNENSRFEVVHTWYDYALFAATAISAVLTLATAAMYVLSRRKGSAAVAAAVAQNIVPETVIEAVVSEASDDMADKAGNE